MSWAALLLQYAPQILAALATGVTLLRPYLIAHGVPEAAVDKLLELLGLFTVGATRAILPADNKGITYGAVAAGTAAIVGGSLIGVNPDTTLTLGAAALGVSGLGFQRAVRSINRERGL